MLVDGCKWLPIGNETINTDGTGQYQIDHDSKECVSYQVKYEWQQTGRQFFISEQEFTGRDNCDETMQPSEPSESMCMVTSLSDKGFDCLYTDINGDKGFYRYLAQPHAT